MTELNPPPEAYPDGAVSAVSSVRAQAARLARTRFVKSATRLQELPADDAGREVAFVGRSNAGKSSALNLLTGQKSLARVSKQPGRTQLLNYFEVEPGRGLVDLPGYGFAKVPAAMLAEWRRHVSDYLEQRRQLTGLILLMDIRHPLQPIDQQLLEWTAGQGRPIHALLTKADKLNRGPGLQVLRQVVQGLQAIAPGTTAQLFSALSGVGVEEARGRVCAFLDGAVDRGPPAEPLA